MLKASVEAAECKIQEPRPGEARQDKIDDLIFCAVLDRGWPHLVGTLTRQFEYQPNTHAQAIKLAVRIQNLPRTPEDAIPHVFSAMGVDLPPHSLRFKPLQTGMIEIEVPVARLQRLFRGECARVRKWLEPFLADSLAQHYVRTGRKESAGPQIDWLIDNAPIFLTYAIADVINVALQAFVLEYGGVAPGHVTEDALTRSFLSFARYSDGRIRLHRFQHQGEQSFNLSG